MDGFTRALDLPTLLARKSHFLFGPRQTGKTWMVRHQLADALVFDLLDHETYLTLARTPRALREQCRSKDQLVVIDEIQKLPHLLDEVHLLIEGRGLRFLLTGSSARQLRRRGHNLLGGRARSVHLHPLTRHELGKEFDLGRALYRGLLPSIYLSDDPDADLRAYTNDYLREEIAVEAATRSIPAFTRFLQVAALCSGHMLNYQKISSDAQVPRTTVQEYFQILRDTLIGRDLPAWGRTIRRKPITTAKFHFFDVGIARHLQGRGQVREGTPEFGELFEAWMHQELAAWAAYHGDRSLHYWRSDSGFEVDFILDETAAIETKAARTPNERHLAGLRALREERRLRRYVLVTMEPRPRSVDGIEVWPWAEFLERLWDGQVA